MKVKKFNCICCGAPKINPYKSPYIVCDFCGSFTDIDYTMGLDAWKTDPKRNEKYQKASAHIQSKLDTFFKEKNKEEYCKLQVSYWDLYYNLFPEYLSPTLTFDHPNYKLYIDICADYSTQSAFDSYHKDQAKELAGRQKAIKYDSVNGQSKVQSDSFFKMIDFYIGYVQDSFRLFYDTPGYELMHQILPEKTHLKMKLSTLVQIWLPYVKEKDAPLFLEKTGLSNEYASLPEIKSESKLCDHCKSELSVPENSFKVHCENCHTTNVIRRQINCVACGFENSVPEVPTNIVNCSSCNVENRLITAQFG